MARRSDGEKIDDLEKLVATLTERLDNTIRELRDVGTAHAGTGTTLADFRREVETGLLQLRRDIDELKAWKDEQKRQAEERGRRLWAFGPNLLGAVVTVLLSASVAYFISRR